MVICVGTNLHNAMEAARYRPDGYSIGTRPYGKTWTALPDHVGGALLALGPRGIFALNHVEGAFLYAIFP
jgi:hypothetical protein